ncbi:hypothetical protein ONZ45_g13910 [Pleurotus djamor]|nr:hypothetical protein ONZ45_g13910 [Pleurotus djamor]
MAPKAKGDLISLGPNYLVHELDWSPPPSPGDSPYPQDPYKLFEHASRSPTTTVGSRLRSSSKNIPDVIIASLKLLLSASEGVPFPPVAVAAQLVITVMEKVSQVKQNKKAFVTLAYTAGDIIRTVLETVRQQTATSGADISHSFHSDINQLLRFGLRLP